MNADVIIKDLVAENFRSAEVFEKYGIDFCCKGNRPLNQACAEKNINVDQILSELKEAAKLPGGDSNRYDEWELDYLIMHIVNNHHKYVLRSIPVITEHLQRVVNAHSANHPFVQEVAYLFDKVKAELFSHMQKEENILFPAINKMIQAKRSGEDLSSFGNFSVKNPIEVMEREHDSAGDALEKIRTLTSNFTLPQGACTTFAVTYKELDEFEKDLHKHVFLENSILFPKAIQMENDLRKN